MLWDLNQSFLFLAQGHLIVSAPIVEKVIFYSRNCLCTFVASQVTMYTWINFLTLRFVPRKERATKEPLNSVSKLCPSLWLTPKDVHGGQTPTAFVTATGTGLRFQLLLTTGKRVCAKVSSAKLTASKNKTILLRGNLAESRASITVHPEFHTQQKNPLIVKAKLSPADTHYKKC